MMMKTSIVGFIDLADDAEKRMREIRNAARRPNG
jgi:hypothetical protein